MTENRGAQPAERVTEQPNGMLGTAEPVVYYVLTRNQRLACPATDAMGAR